MEAQTMIATATDGRHFEALMRMALPILKDADPPEAPRPGAPIYYAAWQMAAMVLIATLARRKGKGQQYIYLSQRRPWVCALLGLERWPARSTYYERYRRLGPTMQAAVKAQGEEILEAGLTDATSVAVDETLIPAVGPVQHRHRKQRRGADVDAAWGYCKHHGWVFGYKLEAVVASTQNAIVAPLLGSCGPANRSDACSFLDQVEHLPAQTTSVLADRAYDTNACGEAVEWDQDGHANGRHLVCPRMGRAGKPKVSQQVRRGKRERSRQARIKRLAFFESPEGQSLYDRRSKTIEPFFEWFKQLFDLHDHVWHRGLPNNCTQMLTAMFGYQLLVRYTNTLGCTNGRIKYILDGL
jgi:hypothetical protein